MSDRDLIGMTVAVAEIFTHVDPTTEPPTVRHFDVGAMQRYVFDSVLQHGGMPEGTAVVRAPLDEGLVRLLQERGGVEERRVQEIDGGRELPAFFVDFSDGKQLIVDGHHRLVRQYRDGAREVPMVEFKAGSWERFLIQLPPEIEREFLDDIKEVS